MRSELSTHSLTAMNLDQGKALVRRYLGSFPSLNLHDPEIYVADLCALLCGYPLWAGEKAIEKVKDTIKFPTTHAEIKPLLEDQVKLHRYAAEWERNAQLQTQETDLLTYDGPKEPRLTYEQMRAKYDGPNGEPWGMDTPVHVVTPKHAREKIIDQIGQEAFDKLPNAPTRARKLSL